MNGFYNRVGQCLLREANWVFNKTLRFVLLRVKRNCAQVCIFMFGFLSFFRCNSTQNHAYCLISRSTDCEVVQKSVNDSVSQTVVRGPQVVLGFCPCGPFRLNISPKKDRTNKINVNCVSHTIVENLKQNLEITYNKRL